MKLKHILVSSLLGLAILSFQPNFVNAETDPSLQDINDTTQDAAEQIDTPDQATNNENQEYDESENTDSENNEATNEQDNTATNEDSDATENNEQYTSDNIESEFQPETDIQSPEKEDQDLDSKSETEDAENPEDELETKADKTKEDESATLNNAEEKEDKSDSPSKVYSISNKSNLSGKEIVKLKKDLTKLGFGRFPDNPSQVYGQVTANVVMEFQKTYGLKSDGVINQSTLSKLSNVLNNSLTIGEKSKRVIILKEDLTQLGFGRFPSNPSQNYGSVTANVVKEFQTHFKLRISGVADIITLDKIKEVLEPPYRNGDRGLHIVELKKDLTELGFGNFPNNPSLAYGSVTATVVKEFQKEYGLKNDGIAHQATLNKLTQILKDSLKNGDRGSKVRDLKNNLSQLGFGNFPNNPSQTYGNVTANVVKKFQKEYGLRVSGVAEEKTLSKLKEILNPPYKNGDKGRHIITLKNNLTALGFGNFPKNPSKNYGSVTANVVKELQKFFGLDQNGIVNTEELQIINEGLHNPVQSKSVETMKRHLTKLGFGNFPNNPSQTYGRVTSRVVKEFQQYYGIKATGNAGYKTLRTLKENVNSPYQKGKSSSRISKLKKDLRNLGFGNFPKNPSRNYGSITERVVNEFQRANGLVVNGIMDSVSLKKLNNSSKKVRIFIDPGHGGRDPGAGANGLREKDLTLDIAKEIERLLKQYQNVEIMMARSTDEYLDLKDRTKMANDWRADYFLSVHINAGGGTGIESYVHNKNATADAKNKQNIIHDHLMNGLKADNIRDRGKKDANFHVLRESKMSALLIEYMFIDTNSDANKLKSTPFTNKLARLTAEGVAKSFGLRK